MDIEAANRGTGPALPLPPPPVPHHGILTEAIKGSVGWSLTGAVFGALIGWAHGGLALGIAAGTVGAVVFGMVGWVLGTAVGIADYWPVSRFLGRVLGGTFVGAVYGRYLFSDLPRQAGDRRDSIILLWALAGALMGASTSIKFVRLRGRKYHPAGLPCE
jgi:hypothetical protein